MKGNPDLLRSQPYLKEYHRLKLSLAKINATVDYVDDGTRSRMQSYRSRLAIFSFTLRAAVFLRKCVVNGEPFQIPSALSSRKNVSKSFGCSLCWFPGTWLSMRNVVETSAVHRLRAREGDDMVSQGLSRALKVLRNIVT